ncbi:MAG: hypothetical protein J6J23_02500, partial [Clostridia bacterium]|nr:hypothetical protein [Clostridia bacterium]
MGEYYFYCVVTIERIYDADKETSGDTLMDETQIANPVYGSFDATIVGDIQGFDVRNNGSNEVLTTQSYVFNVGTRKLEVKKPYWVVTEPYATPVAITNSKVESERDDRNSEISVTKLKEINGQYKAEIRWVNDYNSPAVGDVNIEKYVVTLYDKNGKSLEVVEVAHQDKSTMPIYSVDFTEAIEFNEMWTPRDPGNEDEGGEPGTYYVKVELVPSETNNAEYKNVIGDTKTSYELYTVEIELNNNLVKMYNDADLTIENKIKHRFVIDGGQGEYRRYTSASNTTTAVYTINGNGFEIYFRTVDGFFMPANDDQIATINGVGYDALIVTNNGTALDGYVSGGTPAYTYARSAVTAGYYVVGASSPVELAPGSDLTKGFINITDEVNGSYITGPVTISILPIADNYTITGHTQVNQGVHTSTGGTITLDGFYHKDNDGRVSALDAKVGLLSSASTSVCASNCAEILATFSRQDRNAGGVEDRVIGFTSLANPGYVFKGFFVGQTGTSIINEGQNGVDWTYYTLGEDGNGDGEVDWVAISGDVTITSLQDLLDYIEQTTGKSCKGVMGVKMTMTAEAYETIVGTNGIYARFEPNRVDVKVLLDGAPYQSVADWWGLPELVVKLYQNGAPVYTLPYIPNDIDPDYFETNSAQGIVNGSYEIWTNGRQGRTNGNWDGDLSDEFSYTGVKIFIFNDGSSESRTETIYYNSMFLVSGLVGLQSIEPQATVLGKFSNQENYIYDVMIIEDGYDYFVQSGELGQDPEDYQVKDNVTASTGTAYIKAESSSHTFKNWDMFGGTISQIRNAIQNPEEWGYTQEDIDMAIAYLAEIIGLMIGNTESAETTVSHFGEIGESINVYANFVSSVRLPFGFSANGENTRLEITANPNSGYNYTYQWYIVAGERPEGNIPSGGEAIVNGTENAYALPCDYSLVWPIDDLNNPWYFADEGYMYLPVGTYYFYVVVYADPTNTYGNTGYEYIGAVTVEITQTQLATPDGLYWSTDNTSNAIANWNPVNTMIDLSGGNAVVTGLGSVEIEHYLVKLYKNGSLLTSVTTKNTSFDFAEIIDANGKGNYTFTVQAIASAYQQYVDERNSNLAGDGLCVIDSAVSANSSRYDNKVLNTDEDFTAGKYGTLYTVHYTLSNVTENGGIKYILEGEDYSSTFTSGSGYVMPDSVVVKVGGTTVASANYTYTRPTDGQTSNQYASLLIPTATANGYIEIEIIGDPNRVLITINKDNLPYTGLEVTLRDENGDIVSNVHGTQSVLTDNGDGTYSISAIPNGTYYIWTDGRRGDGEKLSSPYSTSNITVNISNCGSDGATATINYYSIYVNAEVAYEGSAPPTGISTDTLNSNIVCTFADLLTSTVAADPIVPEGFIPSGLRYHSIVIESSGTAVVSCEGGIVAQYFRTWGITNPDQTDAEIASQTSQRSEVAGFTGETIIYASMSEGTTIYTYGFTDSKEINVLSKLDIGTVNNYQWYMVIGGTSLLPTGGYLINRATESSYLVAKDYTKTDAYSIEPETPGAPTIIHINWLPVGTYYFYCKVTTTKGIEYTGATKVIVEPATLDAPDGLHWETDGESYAKAVWNPVAQIGAEPIVAYQVKLYNQNGHVKEIFVTTIDDTSYNLTRFIDLNKDGWISESEMGSYYFTVSALTALNDNVLGSEESDDSGELHTISYGETATDYLSNLTANNGANNEHPTIFVKDGDTYTNDFTSNDGYIMPQDVTSVRIRESETSEYIYSRPQDDFGYTTIRTASLTVTSLNGYMEVDIDAVPNKVEVTINLDNAPYTGLDVYLSTSTTTNTQSYTLTYNSEKNVYEVSAVVGGAVVMTAPINTKSSTYYIWTNGRQGDGTKLDLTYSGVSVTVANNGTTPDRNTVTATINYYSIYVHTNIAGIGVQKNDANAYGYFYGTNSGGGGDIDNTLPAADVPAGRYTHLVIEEDGYVGFEQYVNKVGVIFRAWMISNDTLETDGGFHGTDDKSTPNAVAGLNTVKQSTTVYATFGAEYTFEYGFTDDKVINSVFDFGSTDTRTVNAVSWFYGTDVIPSGSVSSNMICSNEPQLTLPNNYSLELGEHPNLNWLPVGIYYIYCDADYNVDGFIDYAGAVQVTITYRELDTPTNLHWTTDNKTTAVANWNASAQIGAYGAKEYQVRLYKNGVLVPGIGVDSEGNIVDYVITEGTSYDFASIIAGADGRVDASEMGNYTFTVKAISSDPASSDPSVWNSGISDPSKNLYTVTYYLSNIVENGNINYLLEGSTAGFSGSDYSSTFTANAGYIAPNTISVKTNGTSREFTYIRETPNTMNASLAIAKEKILGYVEIFMDGDYEAIENKVEVIVQLDGLVYEEGFNSDLKVYLSTSSATNTETYELTLSGGVYVSTEPIINDTYYIWTNGRQAIKFLNGEGHNGTVEFTTYSGISLIVYNNGSNGAPTLNEDGTVVTSSNIATNYKPTVNFYTIYVNEGLVFSSNTITQSVISSYAGYTNDVTSATGFETLIIESGATVYLKTESSNANTKFDLWRIANTSTTTAVINNEMVNDKPTGNATLTGFNSETTVYTSWGENTTVSLDYGFTSVNTIYLSRDVTNSNNINGPYGTSGTPSYQWFLKYGTYTNGYGMPISSAISTSYTLPNDYTNATSILLEGPNDEEEFTLYWLPVGEYTFYCRVTYASGEEYIGAV